MARTIAKDHDDKRRAILKTAARFFAENGYDRASMSQLSVECGVSKALIYHYYSGKEVLLFDILNSHLTALLAEVSSIGKVGKTPQEHLKALVQALLQNYKNADVEHRLQLEAMTSLPTTQQAELAGVQKQLVQVVSDAIELIEPDYFAANPKNLRPVTMSLFAMLNWFYLWYRKGAGITRKGYADLATDILLSGLKGVVEKKT
ncbi:MAG: TetR/AcrR family transcriptional regulator [Rhodobacteraceae bacterium]|nr:TetR/AcrR family transcriptional regulator [Paracoccaceae bacterium]